MENTLRQWYASLTRLPDDMNPQGVRITVDGRSSVRIEKHGGLLEYTAQRIRVRAGKGEVCIRGEGLHVGRMFPGLLEIRGQIREVSV